MPVFRMTSGVVLLLALLLVWITPTISQDPPKPAPPAGGEEEEDPGTRKPVKPVPVEDDPPPAAKPPMPGNMPPMPGNVPPVPPGTPPMPGMPPLPGGMPPMPGGMPPMPGGPDTPPPLEPLVDPNADAGNIYVAKLDDVVRAAASARNPGLKGFFNSYQYAFDRVTHINSRTARITPVPLLWGKDRFPPEFGVAPVDDQFNVGDVSTLNVRFVRKIDPFELIVIEDVTNLLRPPAPGTKLPPDPPSEADKLAAAERLLTAVMFFHDSAREQNKRRGKNWDNVKIAVYEKLTEIRIRRIHQAGIDKDWVRLKELTTRLIDLYKSNPKVLEQVYAARLAEAETLVKSEKVIDLERGREILGEYDARFPNTGNEAASRVRTELSNRAKKFINDAERIFNVDKTQARNILKSIEAIDPENSSLRDMQQQLKTGYPTLIVATKRLPDRMSPSQARFVSEIQASELMFEGLLDSLPDDQTGVRFLPALAVDRPGVAAGIRDFQLVRSAGWTGPDRGLFDAADLAGTLRLFQKFPTSWAAEPGNWFDNPGFDPNDPGRVRLRFRTGYPDPRSLLTFKVHPARWLLEKNKSVDDLEFARLPFGTGPFKLDPKFKPAVQGEPAKDVVFHANPNFGARPGRTGQPFIKEIRFVDVNQFADPSIEFRADRIHILTDVPTSDLPKYKANNNLNGRVKIVTAAVNRREWILAINHRKPALANPDFRRGLLHTIDRERILSEVFRAGDEGAHKALNGPFPPGTWANPRPVGAVANTLYNRDLAQTKFRQYLLTPEASITMTIVFPSDDPQARSACERMKTMIEAATATEDRKLTIGLEPLPPRELYRRVEEEQRFDLAYLPFDYRDDWYPQALSAFLDPNCSSPGGRNYLGYLAKETVPTSDDSRLALLLTEVRLFRDPGRLDQLAQEIHKRFNDAVPFVPLWQLDRHMVISTSVKIGIDGLADEGNPAMLNPTTLFTSIGRWRVE